MSREARPRQGVSLGAAWSLLYIGASRLGTFGLSVLVARMLGPGPAGAFGIALQATTLAAFLGTLNIGQAQAQRLGELADRRRQRRVMAVALGLIVAGTALTGGALSLLAPWIAGHVYHDPSLAPVLAWCGPLAVGTGLVMWGDGALQGLHRFRQLAAWGAASSLFDLVVSGLAALAGLPALLAARTAVRVGSAIAAWRLGTAPAGAMEGPVAGAAVVAGEASSSIALRLLRFGGLSFLAAAVVVLGHNLLRLLLVRESGLAAAGQFQVADTIGQVLQVVPTAAGIAYLPTVARDHAVDSPLLGASIARAARRVTGFNLPLCLAVIVLGPAAVRLVFGAVYGVAGETLQWLAAAYALAGLASIAGPVLLGRAEVGSAIVLNLVWLAALAATMLLGANRAGAEGAALALCLAHVVQLVPCAVIAMRRWKFDPRTSLGPVLATLFLPALAILGLRARPGASLVIGTAILAVATILFIRWAGPELAAARTWGRREGTG